MAGCLEEETSPHSANGFSIQVPVLRALNFLKPSILRGQNWTEPFHWAHLLMDGQHVNRADLRKVIDPIAPKVVPTEQRGRVPPESVAHVKQALNKVG